MKSLRGQLIFFWVLLLAVSVALGAVMVALFRQSAGEQIAASTRSAEQACRHIAVRYAKSLADPSAPAPQLDLLNVVLQLVLIETPRVEGGVWSRQGGFLAYAYPTYEGSGVKRDVPEAEEGHLAELAGLTAQRQEPQTDVVRASREALIVSTCPLVSPDRTLVAWTMTRTPTGLLDAQESMKIGLGMLLAAVLASAIWIATILGKGWQAVSRLEEQVDDDKEGVARPLPLTGIRELDRIVAALNRSRERSSVMQERLRVAERDRARSQRLATLGRMTGGVAHEIRNPIAAMRLKAENALAAPESSKQAALTSVLGQIERLDELVQRLLAIVQPIALQKKDVSPSDWLATHVHSFEPKAAAKGVRLVLDAIEDASHDASLDASRGELLSRRSLQIDPLHFGRALDNLLDNAVRHASSEVRVSVDARKAGAVVRVSDDGPGVPEGMQEQLFEPFATGRHDGTGLGLAMAREVALAHGGDLRYVSQARGACFELEVPWPGS